MSDVLIENDLWSLLADAANPDGYRLVATSPVLRRQLTELMPQIERRSRPMARDDLLARLIAEAPALGIDERSPEEWASLFEPYLADLAPFSAEAISAAFVGWKACELYPASPGRHTFYPRPEELITLAEPVRNLIGMVAHRARKALAYAEKHPPRLTAADRARERQAAIDAGILDADGKVVLRTAPPTPDHLRAAAMDAEAI